MAVTTAKFSVEAKPDSANYKWMRNSSTDLNFRDVPDGPQHRGTKTKELTISKVSPDDEGDYRCKVWISKEDEAVYSKPAKLTIGNHIC